MNKFVSLVVAGFVLLGTVAWLLAMQLTGGPEDYRARHTGSMAAESKATEKALPQPAPQLASDQERASSVVAHTETGPPLRRDIPDNQFGELVRQGERVFNDPQQYASDYVKNELTCQNCHFDGGRYEKTGSMRSAWPMYPAYRGKNQHVNDFAERIQGCFIYSMNGEAPPRDGEVIQALQAYSFWLAKGMPTGKPPKQRGFPDIEEPSEAPSRARGEAVYQDNCALCHGPDGQGQKAKDGTLGFPPLWGKESYNWGAGMHRINTAASFIKAVMPLGKADLSNQEAWDVSLFINSHKRPQDPRFTGSVEETAERFHQHRGEYGKTWNGQLLGEGAE